MKKFHQRSENNEVKDLIKRLKKINLQIMIMISGDIESSIIEKIQ